MEWPSSFVHVTSVIEQPDMCQDSAEAIVSMRQIALQREGALELRNRFQMLEILRRSPQQEGTGDMGFGQIRVYFERAPAMEFSFSQPHAGWVKLEVASRTHK